MITAIIFTKDVANFFKPFDLVYKHHITHIESGRDMLTFHITETNTGQDHKIEMCAYVKEKEVQNISQDNVRWDWHIANFKALPGQPMCLQISENNCQATFQF